MQIVKFCGGSTELSSKIDFNFFKFFSLISHNNS